MARVITAFERAPRHATSEGRWCQLLANQLQDNDRRSMEFMCAELSHENRDCENSF